MPLNVLVLVYNCDRTGGNIRNVMIPHEGVAVEYLAVIANSDEYSVYPSNHTGQSVYIDIVLTTICNVQHVGAWLFVSLFRASMSVIYM